MGDGRILGIRKWFSRFAVALGGFLIFVGIIIIGVFLIDYFGMIDLNILETENLQNLPFFMLLAIGLVDLIAGIILWRR
jgi:uncharacterized membrane protein (Fun14 family)